MMTIPCSITAKCNYQASSTTVFRTATSANLCLNNYWANSSINCQNCACDKCVRSSVGALFTVSGCYAISSKWTVTYRCCWTPPNSELVWTDVRNMNITRRLCRLFSNIIVYSNKYFMLNIITKYLLHSGSKYRPLLKQSLNQIYTGYIQQFHCAFLD